MQPKMCATERSRSSGFSSPSTIFEEEEDFSYGKGGFLAQRLGFCGSKFERLANPYPKVVMLDGSSPQKGLGRRGSQDSPFNKSSAKNGRRRHTTVESGAQGLPLQLKPFRAVIQTDQPRKETVTADERKAKTFLKKLQHEIPHLVYIRSDLTCRSLLAPDPQTQVMNYFDWELAKTRRMQKKDGTSQAKYANGLADDYVELNFENSLGLSFRNSSQTNPLHTGWHVATHPRTYFLELAVPPNTPAAANTSAGSTEEQQATVLLQQTHAYSPPFAFAFFVTFPENDSDKEKTVSASFRIINTLPPFQEFGVWVRSKQNPEWRLGGKGFVRDNDQDWIRIEKSVRHRGAGLKTMEFNWEQKLEEDPQDLEFSLTPYTSLRQLKSIIPFSSKVQLGTLARGICRPHSHYLLLSSRPSTSLSAIRSQTLLVLNFLSPSFSPTLFSILPGLVETFQATGSLSIYLRHNITTLVLLPGVLNFEREKETADRILRKLSERNRIAAVINVLPSWIPNSGVFLEANATDSLMHQQAKRPSVVGIEEPSEGRTGRKRVPDREPLFRELVMFFRECCNHFEEGRCKLIETTGTPNHIQKAQRLDENTLSCLSGIVCDARIPMISSQTRRSIDPEDLALIGSSLIKGFVMLVASRAAQMTFGLGNLNNKEAALESFRALLKKPKEQEQLDASILQELLNFENDCKESRLRFGNDFQKVKIVKVKNKDKEAETRIRTDSLDKRSADSKSLSSKRGSNNIPRGQIRRYKANPSKRTVKIVLYANSDSDSNSSDSQARESSIEKKSRNGVVSIFKTALHGFKNMVSYRCNLEDPKIDQNTIPKLKQGSPLRASSEKDLRDQKKLNSVKRGSFDLKITQGPVVGQPKMENPDKENLAHAHNAPSKHLPLKTLFQQISIAPGNQNTKLKALSSVPAHDAESVDSRGRGQSQDYSDITSTTEQLSTRRSLHLPSKPTATPQSRQGHLLMNKSFRVKHSSKDKLSGLPETSISINDCSPAQRLDYSTRLLTRKAQDESTSISQHTGTLREILTARSKPKVLPDFCNTRRISVGPEALQERAMFRIAKKESSGAWDHHERQSLSRANPVEEAFPVTQQPLRTVVLNIPTNQNVQRAVAVPSTGLPPAGTMSTRSPIAAPRKRQTLRTDATGLSGVAQPNSTNKAASRLFLPQMCLNRRDF